MSYSAAVDGLFALAGELHSAPGGGRRKFELAAMRVLMEALGSPQQRFRSVLIAGTNGKGSTASTLASILRTGGYRTGLYTSPHLIRVNERVRVDGQDISDDDFASYYFRVDDCARKLVAGGRLQWHPSFFETMTALAFLEFADREVDIAVLEVGMGGRLDATNIVEPLVSVITDISLDHTEWLGGTIGEIAREKAGILRENGVLVTLPQHPEANQAIGEAAVALHVRGVNAAEYVPERGSEDGAYELAVLDERISVSSPLAGSHQKRNVALAIAAAVELSNHHGYKLSVDRIAEGVRATRWPGRLERFSPPGQPDVLMDVAHNPAGAWALRAALSHLDPQPGTLTAVFGCLKDKAFSEMGQILFPMFETVVLTEVPSPRTASLDELRCAAEATGVRVMTAANPQEALARAMNITPPDGIVVVAGSVYLAGGLRALLLKPVPEPVS
jgi:dihydrofolate synthase / folylpolyglutamate synthase